MPKLNKEKLDQMVKAVFNEMIPMPLIGLYDAEEIDTMKSQIRTALTPFAMEMTDDELFDIASKTGGSDTWIEGAKFIRDGK